MSSSSSSSSSSSQRKHAIVVDIGCSNWRAKLSSFFSFSSSPNSKKPYSNSLNGSFSYEETSKKNTSEMNIKKERRRVNESVAVEKESSEPYFDFRESMVQMIVENEMYGWDELRELLHRLLALNSPRHHPLIQRAFSDVCRAVFSPLPPRDGHTDEHIFNTGFSLITPQK